MACDRWQQEAWDLLVRESHSEDIVSPCKCLESVSGPETFSLQSSNPKVPGLNDPPSPNTQEKSPRSTFHVDDLGSKPMFTPDTLLLSYWQKLG